MNRRSMPVVRLLLCALLFGAASASATPSDRMSASVRVAATDLPTTSSFSGYIIAVG